MSKSHVGMGHDLATASGLSPDELARVDRASNHRYECRCDDCVFWWSVMPPEEDDE